MRRRPGSIVIFWHGSAQHLGRHRVGLEQWTGGERETETEGMGDISVCLVFFTLWIR